MENFNKTILIKIEPRFNRISNAESALSETLHPGANLPNYAVRFFFLSVEVRTGWAVVGCFPMFFMPEAKIKSLSWINYRIAPV